MRCPQCNRDLVEVSPRCPSCQADLGLLVDYVSHLQGGLDRAENLTKAGELGQAVWAYLEVLEVDPDNPTARRQVGQVATAVRQFDQTAPGRRWLNRIRGESDNWLLLAMRLLFIAAMLFVAFTLGYSLATPEIDSGPPEKPAETLTGK